MKTISRIALIALFALGPAATADAQPSGFTTRSIEVVTTQVEHLVLTSENPPQVAHIGHIGPEAPVTLRSVLSNGLVAGPGLRSERTSAMCVRTGCLMAVNGDFYDLDHEWPLGGMVSAGEIVRTPTGLHHQLIVDRDGHLSAGSLRWTGTFVGTDLNALSLDGVNVPRSDNQLIAYTASYGPSTETNQFGSELTAEVVEPPGPLRLGQTARVHLTGFRSAAGDSPIPSNGVVLSGHGNSATLLEAFWARVQTGEASAHALIRFDSPSRAIESIGGTPILVKNGKRWFAAEASSFIAGRHPRTIVGWNSAGDTWLVTVDGRQPGYSVGMTLEEAADFMIALGATEALNLDGGGSSTFVNRGIVVNRPSDRAVKSGKSQEIVHVPSRRASVLGNVERPVTNALVIIPKLPQQVNVSDPLEQGAGLPGPLALPFSSASDPGSNPLASMPVIVHAEETDSPSTSLGLIALALNLGAAVLIKSHRVKLNRRRDATAA